MNNRQIQYPKTAISDGTSVLGVSTSPLRGDPTGTTIQPVSIPSGSITGTVTAVGAAPSGAAASGNPVLVGGSDGADARTITTDTTGAVRVAPSSANVATGQQALSTTATPGRCVENDEDLPGDHQPFRD
jgi:hypothetical protein